MNPAFKPSLVLVSVSREECLTWLLEAFAEHGIPISPDDEQEFLRVFKNPAVDVIATLIRRRFAELSEARAQATAQVIIESGKAFFLYPSAKLSRTPKHMFRLKTDRFPENPSTN